MRFRFGALLIGACGLCAPTIAYADGPSGYGDAPSSTIGSDAICPYPEVEGGDRYVCCVTPDWASSLWVNTKGDNPFSPPSACRRVNAGQSWNCTADTGVYSSGPPNISVAQDCKNHGNGDVYIVSIIQ